MHSFPPPGGQLLLELSGKRFLPGCCGNHRFGHLAQFGVAVLRDRHQDLPRIGRPPAMNAEQVRHARALFTDAENTITSIAKLLGVSRTILYKYVPELAAGRDSLIAPVAGPALPAPRCPALRPRSSSCSGEYEQSRCTYGVSRPDDESGRAGTAELRRRLLMLSARLWWHPCWSGPDSAPAACTQGQIIPE